jgi:tetratricopeptide (TPR) repeat protein
MLGCRIALLASIATGLCLADSLSDALRSGRFQDALNLSDGLLKTRPRDPAVWTGRGIALTGLHRDRESISSFEQALKISPDFLPALKAAAEAGYRSRDPRAAGFVERLIRLEPENHVAHAIAGVLAFEAGDCHRAVPHFEKARTEIAANQQAFPLYGACLVALDRAADAVAVFEQLVVSQPGSALARFNLGYAQVLAHRNADAVKTLEPLASGPHANADALNLLAAAEASEGRLESAVARLQQAIRLAPNEEGNYVDLAGLCLQNESGDTAVAIVEAGLAILPQSARLHTLRGVLKAEVGKYDDAAAEFDLANRLDPSRLYGAAAFGVLYTETRQADLAATVLRERLRKSPGDATLNFLLAQALVQEGAAPSSPEFAEAVRCLKVALGARPDFAKAHSLLGKLYVQTLAYPEAVEQLRLATGYDGSDRMAWSQLAIALRRLGRNEEAATAVDALKRIVIADAHPKPNLKRIRIVPVPDRPQQ